MAIRDDRGEPAALVSPPDIWPKVGWWDSKRQIAQLDSAMQAEFRWAIESARVYGFIGGLSLAVTGGAIRYLLSVPPSWPAWVAGLAGMVLPGIAMWPMYPPIASWFRKRHADQLRSGYLKAQRCASCGYRLEHLAADQEGCTQCPECGLVWRLDPSP